MSANIAIIGVGEIGFRHLQSLATEPNQFNIEVVDPSDKARALAKKKLHPHTKKIHFFSNISKLSTSIDIAIIATTAKVRRQVIEQLLQQKSVKYLILEKVLFQKREDYEFVQQLLMKKNVKTWVNCPLRLHPFFHKLRAKMIQGEKVDYFHSGNLLGITCNAIHHIDLLAFLTNQIQFTFDTTQLDEKIVKSRRDGYIEFTGTLLGRTNEGSLIKLTSYTNDSNRPPFFQISSQDFLCFIHMKDKKYWLMEKDKNWAVEEGGFEYLLQSELTLHVVKEILRTESCGLTPYEESMKLHLSMLEAFINFLNQQSDEEVKICPIT